ARRVRATRPPRVQEWEAPDPGQRRRAIPRALTNGSSRGTLHSGPMSVAELGLGWRSTGELGIGDELLRRQVATAPVLVHGPNKGKIFPNTCFFLAPSHIWLLPSRDNLKIKTRDSRVG
uniref:Uncharacterized protein n=1 Tax=Aegilops tauschii subsp. strangulata TaxID=200361 RepID=A0A453MIP8_AEGTS